MFFLIFLQQGAVTIFKINAKKLIQSIVLVCFNFLFFSLALALACSFLIALKLNGQKKLLHIKDI